MSSGGKDDLLDELAASTRRMRSLDLSPLQAEILRQLMDGKRTLSEVALTFYGVRYGDDSYEAHYSRLRRADLTISVNQGDIFLFCPTKSHNG